MMPVSNWYVSPAHLHDMEPFYPLHARVCGKCFLVQVPEVVSPEKLFREYAYFSSYSSSWVAHARTYCHAMVERFGLGNSSLVVEIASNDGYLLQHFVERHIPVLGIEPAANVAKVAEAAGIPTLARFFGTPLAQELRAAGKTADLIVGNNVLAHVPHINDFVEGLRVLLKARGVITMEFPHLFKLIEHNEFDTIYHEHFSYLSFFTVKKIFAAHGLTVFDVEELPTHGGSLRIFACHAENQNFPIISRASELERREIVLGVTDIETYLKFSEQVKETKRKLLSLLISLKQEGKTIVGYGAPAKGNTLLNYCGIRTDFLDYTVDRNPHKQNRFLPGTRIPIYGPERITETRPDYVLILPWNLTEEIVAQMAHIRSWGGQFIVPIPEPRIL